MPTPLNPTITIVFNGTLLFASKELDERYQYQLGVLKAKDHVLRINRRTTVGNIAGELREVAAQENGKHLGNISIEIPDRNGREGVSHFNSPNGTDPQDFGWVIDLEGPKFHNRKLPLKDGFPSQSIFVHQGLFYTFLAMPACLVKPDGTEQEISIASPIGCNFYLNEGERFILRCSKSDKKVEITAKAGTTDYIEILNTPRVPGQLRDGHDFPNYYALAVDVPVKEQFNILASKTRPLILPFGDPQFPCPCGWLGKHTDGLTNK